MIVCEVICGLDDCCFGYFFDLVDGICMKFVYMLVKNVNNCLICLFYSKRCGFGKYGFYVIF